MAHKTQKISQQVVEVGDEHELLQQENFEWLGELRDSLSPYWATRLEYQPETHAHVLVIEGTERHQG